jgi:hypothetical protein
MSKTVKLPEQIITELQTRIDKLQVDTHGLTPVALKALKPKTQLHR